MAFGTRVKLFGGDKSTISLSELQGTGFGPNTKIVQAGQPIQSVIDGCDSPEEGNAYVVMLPPGVWNEQIVGRNYVSLRGSGRYSTIIQHEESGYDYGTIILGDQTLISNMTIKATGAGMAFFCPDKALTFMVKSCNTESTFDIVRAEYDNAVRGYFYDSSHKIAYDGFSAILDGNNIHFYIFNNIIELGGGDLVRPLALHAVSNCLIEMYGGRIIGSAPTFLMHGAYIEQPTAECIIRLFDVNIDLHNPSEITSGFVRGAYCSGAGGKIEIYGGSITTAADNQPHHDIYQRISGEIEVYGTKYNTSDGTITGNMKIPGNINVGTIAEHADNTAAITAGLVAGDFYRTGDASKIVH